MASIAPELWDDAAWYELTARAVGLAREAGAFAVLPVWLIYRAGLHVHAGEFGAAAGLIEEADAITAATGNASLRWISMMLAAWRGEKTGALELIEAVVRDATAMGEGRAPRLAWYTAAVLYNGLGSYEAALAEARRACEYEDLAFFGVPGRAEGPCAGNSAWPRLRGRPGPARLQASMNRPDTVTRPPAKPGP